MEQQEQSSRFMIPLAILAAGAMVSAAIYFGGSTGSNSLTQNENGRADIEVVEVTSEDHYRGTADAEIVIIEYSDTECPFCKVFHNTMKEVVRSYGGKVAWVYRHFPIPQLHERAMKEAEATECAAELGGNEIFWAYLDEIFETTNSNDSLDPSELPRIAVSLGLDADAFNTCLSSGRYADKVSDHMDQAVRAGARGTPYSIIVAESGEMDVINGAEPLANVKQKIDTLLK